MDLIRFAESIQSLKEIRRTGWVRSGIPSPESVADHILGVALLSMVLSRSQGLDESKAVRMALVHDAGEAIIGDVVTIRGSCQASGALRSEKRRNERLAIARVFGAVGYKDALALYDEFEAGASPEARLVSQLDKLEMVLQAYRYEKRSGVDLDEFYETGFSQIKDKEMIALLKKLYKSRRIPSGRSDKAEPYTVKPGIYRHYKGKKRLYEVLGVARHSESPADLYVVYRGMYHHDEFGDDAIWIRPISLFTGTVFVNGRRVPRFTYVCAAENAKRGRV